MVVGTVGTVGVVSTVGTVVVVRASTGKTASASGGVGVMAKGRVMVLTGVGTADERSTVGVLAGVVVVVRSGETAGVG